MAWMLLPTWLLACLPRLPASACRLTRPRPQADPWRSVSSRLKSSTFFRDSSRTRIICSTDTRIICSIVILAPLLICGGPLTAPGWKGSGSPPSGSGEDGGATLRVSGEAASWPRN
uniref:Secreted protein n=1 Tax=Alexandrium monilatum TaxID=311494 RepID=A0A7S4Q7Z1_9DINO